MSGISKRVSGSWVSGDYGIMKTATDTIKTLPADIYADGNNATVGISGNTVQNGTPTPDNPIMPQGTGERTGNLFDKNDVLQDYRIGGDGLPFNDSECVLSDYIEVTPNTIVNQHRAFSFSNCMAEYDENKTFIIRYVSGSGKITTSANTKYIRVSVVKIGLDEAMVTMGATAPTSYEPYGYKIPISSANTTTPVYLGEVESTRLIKKYEFTGDEAWGRNSENSVFYLAILDGVAGNAITSMCTEYPAIANVSAYANMTDKSICIKSDGSAIWIRDTDISSATDFKTHLAQQYANGTPVTVWYVLRSATTGIVNEPLRKIGDYADTVSGITIPTITGKDTFDVETTLKPSEVTVNYKGWHPVTTVKEWDGSQWN